MRFIVRLPNAVGAEEVGRVQEVSLSETRRPIFTLSTGFAGFAFGKANLSMECMGVVGGKESAGIS